MSKFALKVSIDGIKYVIRGIDKGTSKKEVLCTIAKYKSTEHLPELQKALSKLDGAISIVKYQKLNDRGSSESKCRQAERYRSLTRTKVRSYKQENSLAEKPAVDENIVKGKVPQCEVNNTKKEKEYNGVKFNSVSRSHSFNEKENKRAKKFRNRPWSFGAFDSEKRPSLVELLGIRSSSLGDEQCCTGRNVLGQQIIHDDSDIERAKAKSRKLKNLLKRKTRDDADSGASLMLKEREDNFDVKKTKVRAKICRSQQQNSVDSTAGTLEMHLVDFMKKQDSKLLVSPANCNLFDFNNNISGAKIDAEGKTEDIAKEQDENSLGFADGETDSGLLSIDYESSLDTSSRDGRNSLDQTCDEERLREYNDSGFECNSLNEISNSHESVFKCHAETSSQPKTSGDTNNEADQDDVEQAVDNETLNKIKDTVKDISEIDQMLLHNELRISQLEFQLNVLSEDFDNFDDIEIEAEEVKLISELKEAEEFLIAITRLSQYQSEAQKEMLLELWHLEERLTERQLKARSLERKLLRQTFRTIPRHLNVSKEKRKNIRKLLIIEENIDNEGECFARKSEESCISLV